METYRYMGHSMSDPGITYRTREEINKMRQESDPIIKVKTLLIECKLATEESIEGIEQEIRKEVDEAVEFAKAASYPDPKDLQADVYSKHTGPYYIRGSELSKSVIVNP